MEKLQEAINDKIDIPGVDEQEEGYLIHMLIGLAITILYIFIRNLWIAALIQSSVFLGERAR